MIDSRESPATRGFYVVVAFLIARDHWKRRGNQTLHAIIEKKGGRVAPAIRGNLQRRFAMANSNEVLFTVWSKGRFKRVEFCSQFIRVVSADEFKRSYRVIRRSPDMAISYDRTCSICELYIGEGPHPVVSMDVAVATKDEIIGLIIKWMESNE